MTPFLRFNHTILFFLYQLIKDVMDVVFSEDSPRFADEVMSQSEHEVHCERAWRNLLPELRMWLRELSGLKGSIWELVLMWMDD